MATAIADMKLVKPRPGRPRKYDRPSRPLTVTLPEDVIARLSAIDADLGRAIVSVAERQSRRPVRATRPAEIASYGRHAVIVVTPVKVLKRLPGVQLVPVGAGRALIALEHPHSIPRLELDIRDAIERDGVGSQERRTLEAIADILRRARQTPGLTVEERTIIVLESKRQRRS